MFGWKKDKIKIKAVFKLHFQAIQVPKLKGKGLMISLVPADVGKATVRLKKTPIVEGTCSWENPVFETVKLLKDVKTGKFKEKIYYFDVSTGSSKSGFLGGTAVDFADFAEASTAVLVSLPLDDSEYGPVLNITVEKMHGNDDLRDVDENVARQSESLDGSLRNQMGDFNNLDFIQRTPDVIPVELNAHRRSNTNGSLDSGSEGSVMDSTNSQEERFSTDVPNNPIDLLKREISNLEREAENSDMELRSLRKQVVKENKRGEDLSRKIVSLKEENENLRSQLHGTEDSNSDFDEDKESGLLKKNIEEMHSEIEVINQENEDLKLENYNLTSKLEENRLDRMNLQNKYHESLVSIKDLKLKVEKLESKIKLQAVESLDSLDKINELEIHTKKLENEMDKQAERFRGDLQSERQSKFETDKLSHDLLGQIKVLEDKLQQANEDLRFYEKEMSESEEREKGFDLVRKGLEKTIDVKSCALRDLKDEKAEIVETLQTEIKCMKVQYDEMKQCLRKTEVENESLRKQVSKLEGDLKEKDEKVKSLKQEKIALDEAKFKSISKQDFASVKSTSKTHVNDDLKLEKLLCELSMLKNQNKDMDVELKEMQEKYSEVSLRFAEVEGERQHLVMTLRNLKNATKK